MSRGHEMVETIFGKKHLKAYRTNTCLSSKTEVKDWCKGEQLQFICKKTSEKYKPMEDAFK